MSEEKPSSVPSKKPRGGTKPKELVSTSPKKKGRAETLLDILNGDQSPPPSKKKPPAIPMAFVCSRDLPQILQILVGADKISETEAFMRLQKMCSKGKLQIIPPFSKAPKEVS